MSRSSTCQNFLTCSPHLKSQTQELLLGPPGDTCPGDVGRGTGWLYPSHSNVFMWLPLHLEVVRAQHCPCPPGPSPASLPHLLPCASLPPATLALFLVLRHISCFLCLEGWPQDSCSALPYLESHLSTAFPNPLSKLDPPSTTFGPAHSQHLSRVCHDASLRAIVLTVWLPPQMATPEAQGPCSSLSSQHSGTQ